MATGAGPARRATRVTLLPTVLAVVAALLVPGPAAVAAPAAGYAKPVSTPCSSAVVGDVQCLAVERAAPATAAPDVAADVAPDVADRPNAPVPNGITPSQLQRIYGVANRTPPPGTTVGIVVAFDAPDVEGDLAKFRATFGLAACTTANGCFRKVDQRGRTVPAGKSRTSTVAPVYSDSGWELETSLDTQAVSAMCPSCDIVLVEADSTSLTTALGPAVVRAQTLGAAVISNSFAGGESEDMVAADRDYWSQLDVPVFAASGDHAWNNLDLKAGSTGYNTANYPATSPSVIAVGGTSATVSGNTVTSESAWSDAGSGCSVRFDRPAAQAAYFDALGTRPDTHCTVDGDPMRAAADLSAMADPYAPGFPVYRSGGGGWGVAGGTSLSVQLVAAVAAYAGPRGTQTPIPTVAYGLAAAAAPTGLADITTGTNKPTDFGCSGERICTATAGWDGPTGLGTPRGLSVFAPLLQVAPAASVAGGTVTASGSNFLPGEQVGITVAGQKVATAVVGTDGSYSVSFTVPAGVSGSITVNALGSVSGFTSTVPLVVAPLTVTPTSQTVRTGQTATLRLTGFGAGETVTATADTGGDGTVVATGATGGTGSAVLSWTPSATTNVNSIQRVVVQGLTSGQAVTVRVALVAATGSTPTPPTVLSAVPTTDGGVVVGVRVAATGPRASSVAVLGSDASLTARVPISATGDAFVTVPSLKTGRTATYTAVAGNGVGDSGPSAASLAVTGSDESGAGDLTPVGPVRRYDSRLAGAGGPLGQGATRTLQIAGTAGVPATGVAAVVVSLTLLTPTARTYLTLWPAGETRPAVSNANTAGAGGYKASLAKVKLGANGAISVYNYAGSSGFVLDVVGFYAAAPPGSATTPVFAHNQSYGAVTPVRVADSRKVANSPVRSGGSIAVPIRDGVSGVATGVPADATSVELIVQAVNTTAAGYLTVYPTGRSGGAPYVSNVQAAPNKPVATAVVATIGANGTVTVFAQAHTDVIVDIVGYYAGSADGRFTPISPRRYYDTRRGNGGAFGTGTSRVVPIAGAAALDGSRQVPATATSVSFSLTSTDNTARTYVTAWRAGTARPFVTTLLPDPVDGVFDNLGLAGVGTGGGIGLFNAGGSIQLIVDVQGYYATLP